MPRIIHKSDDRLYLADEETDDQIDIEFTLQGMVEIEVEDRKGNCVVVHFDMNTMEEIRNFIGEIGVP